MRISDRSILACRIAVVMGVLLAMPLLAIPAVNRSVNAWLRGEPPVGDPPARQPDEGRGAEPADGESNDPAAPTEDGADVLREELQQWGAESMTLELADGGFQFRCVMVLPGSVYRRAFQAEAGEPARAVERVHKEVRAWRANRSREASHQGRGRREGL